MYINRLDVPVRTLFLHSPSNRAFDKPTYKKFIFISGFSKAHHRHYILLSISFLFCCCCWQNEYCVYYILYMCLVYYFISQSLDPFPAAGVLKATIIYANFYFFSAFASNISTNTKALTQALKLIHNIMFPYIFFLLSSLPPPFLNSRGTIYEMLDFQKKAEKTEKRKNEKYRKLYVFSFHLWYFFFVEGKLKIMGSLGITLRVLFFLCCCFFFVLKLRKFFLPHYFRFTHLARD